MTALSAAPLEYVYRLEGKLYVNLTSRCRLNCEFCFKFGFGPLFYGHRLLMTRAQEPTVAQVVEAIEEAGSSDELVYCGLGEPLERIDVATEVAKRVRGMFKTIRLNTSGQYDLPGPADPTGARFVEELARLQRLAATVDSVFVSLNAHDAVTYNKICQPKDPVGAFDRVLTFIRSARGLFPSVHATVVDTAQIDLEKCRALCLDLGVPLLVRPHVPKQPLEDGGRPPLSMSGNQG